uniref:keratinocyte-associated protein 3 isoform X1 n=1 Tax=Agelaius phoeniceus TaxID=39638 RepID=UPI0023EB6C61|nr:keratinocyte-associated protein 3 isoform X1 [Agelaius phoeniceus]
MAGGRRAAGALAEPRRLMRTGLGLIVLGHGSLVLGAIVHGSVLRHVAGARRAVTPEYAAANVVSVCSGLLVSAAGAERAGGGGPGPTRAPLSAALPAEHRRGHRGHPGVAQPVPGGPALDSAGRLSAELPAVHGVQRGAGAGLCPHGAQPGHAPGPGLQQLRAAPGRPCSHRDQRLSLQHHSHLRHSPGPLVPLPAAGSCGSRALGQELLGGSGLPGHRALCTQLCQRAGTDLPASPSPVIAAFVLHL